jgi:hypothetical protein
MNLERGGNIFELNLERIAIQMLVDEMQHHVTIAVCVRGFQRGFGVQACAPSRILLRCGGGRDVEGSNFSPGMRGLKIRTVRNPRTPIDGLQLATLVDPEGVGCFPGLENPDLALGEILNVTPRRRCGQR